MGIRWAQEYIEDRKVSAPHSHVINLTPKRKKITQATSSGTTEKNPNEFEGKR